MLLIRLSVTSSCFALWSSVSKSDLSSVSLSVVLRPQKKVGGSWRFLAFCSSSGVGFISHTTWQSDSSHETCKHLQNKWRLGWVHTSAQGLHFICDKHESICTWMKTNTRTNDTKRCEKANRMTNIPSSEDADFFTRVTGCSFSFKALSADSKSSSGTLHKIIILLSSFHFLLNWGRLCLDLEEIGIKF